MREITASLIPKVEVDYLKEDRDDFKKFIEFITDKLTKDISERLIKALEANDEIIIKKPVLRISKYLSTDFVEYRKYVDWEPLVRCKDCKYYDPEDKKCDCGHGILWQLPRHDNWFCADGKRREDEEV